MAAPAAPGDVTVLPDGCMDVIWTGRGLLIAGPDIVPNISRPGHPTDMVGVRFAPGHAVAVLGLRASEFRDQRVDVGQIWSRPDVERWSDVLAESDDPEPALVRLCAQHPQKTVPRWIAAVVPMLGCGVDIATCAAHLSVSERTLHRMSLQYFGYGAKTLARILRMRRAIRLLGSDDEFDLSDVANRAGYADYSHMYREFDALTARVPAAFASAQPSGQ